MTYLSQAWADMADDQAFDEVPPLPEPEVMGLTAHEWTEAERILSTLTRGERETIAVGDQDEWPPIISKLGEPDFDVLHKVLDQMFMQIGL